MLRTVWLLAVLLVFLCGWLVVIRQERLHDLSIDAAPWGAPKGSRRAWRLANVAVVLAIAPLLRSLPFLLFAKNPLLIGDAATHAAIAQDLARSGAPHGWIATYDGGFPLGVNYPPLGWCLGAALIRIGISPVVAIQCIGTLPYVAAPFVVVAIARNVGARPASAVMGALMMAWISPYNCWLGTERSFLGLGLVSQSLGVAFLLVACWALLHPRATWQPWLAGVLLASSHPQITAAFCMLLPVVAIGANRALRMGIVSFFASVAITGIALYGPGLATLRLPFGWIPTQFDWWIVGYPVDRLQRWFVDFELLDLDSSTPAVTSVFLLSLLVLLARTRQRVPRSVLAAFAWGLALTIAGRTLSALGTLGTRVLAFLQPQRAFSMLPLLIAAVIVVAWEEISFVAERIGFSEREKHLARRFERAAPSLVLVLVALVAIPRNDAWLALRIDKARETLAGEGECGLEPPALDWLATIDPARPGRISEIETPNYTYECFKAISAELASPVTLGVSRGAGAHVGVLSNALSNLSVTDPETGDRVSPATDRRAESMGVRWLLYGVDDRPSGAWKILKSTKDIELAERIGGTDTVGVGCIDSRWRGSDAKLKDALFDDLRNGGSILVDPNQLVALDETGNELTKELLATGDCDASHASVAEKRREPGAYEADVESPSPVDVVIRATAFPTWVIRIDGVPAPVTVVAPGFPSARMPAGKHHVEAVVSPPRFYWAGVFLGALVVAGLAFETHRRTGKLRQI